MGAADLQLRQYEEAETYLRKGVAADARNARGQFLYGILQMERDSNEATRQDHLMGAWDHLKTAVRLNPQFAEAHHLLADVLAKMGDKNHAIEEAATAARLNQSNESYFVALGEIYFNFKIYDKAIHVFEQLTSSGNPKVVEHAQKRIEEAKGLASRGAKPLPEQGAAPQEN
jgi:tetratricopeptide (TPR) repeat protein